MNRVQRLAAIVAELRARKMAAEAVPLTADALERAGFRVYRWNNGAGLAVDEAPGLHEKLDEIQGRGVAPCLVCILRNLDEEEPTA